MSKSLLAEAVPFLLQMHVQNGMIIADEDDLTIYLIREGVIKASHRDVFGSMVFTYTGEGKSLSEAITEAGIVCS